MNENEIGTGLAKLGALQIAEDERKLARRVLQRDRRRSWLLTGLAVLFWVIAAVGGFFVVYVATFHLYPKQQVAMRAYATGNLRGKQLIEIQASHFRAVEICTLVVAASFISVTLAAICTLLLILVSRQATLGQINANLIELFEQLQRQRLDTARAGPGLAPE
jgi:hypothetical protein